MNQVLILETLNGKTQNSRKMTFVNIRVPLYGETNPGM